MNSDLCVNDGYCLRHFSVDTAPSTYFSAFLSRTLPRSTRPMTDSGQLRSSTSLPGYHVDFFPFAEHVSFTHSTGSPWPVIFFWKRRKHQQTDKTQKFLHTRSLIGQSASPCSCLYVFGRSAASARSGWGRDFLSNRKYRYHPHTQPDVGNCWPWLVKMSIHLCCGWVKKGSSLPCMPLLAELDQCPIKDQFWPNLLAFSQKKL